MTFGKAMRLYAAWVLAVALHILLRIALIFCIPIIFIWSAYGMKWNQRSAQASFEMSCLFVLRLPRFPRISITAAIQESCRRATKSRRSANRPGKAIPFRPE